jgi:BlaI family transcriptional regulator, penicillinase repressor
VYQATEARGRVAARAVQRIVDWFCNGSAEDMLVRMVDAAMLDRRRLRMLTERVSQTKSGRMMR